MCGVAGGSVEVEGRCSVGYFDVEGLILVVFVSELLPDQLPLGFRGSLGALSALAAAFLLSIELLLKSLLPNNIPSAHKLYIEHPPERWVLVLFL